ncbi:MAG: molybdopterin molybdotransferase MoeA [Gammaproteobacteria bacterium]|nr:molybdopterin molybdotransferase MoeA [Gammaproteobacteria bacterium]
MSEFRGPSCQDLDFSDLVPVERARERLAEIVTKISAVETADLDDVYGRIAADNVICETNVPPHDNAAMDGYAIRASDLPAPGGRQQLALVGVAKAGQPYTGSVNAGECVQVLTGAKMPAGADTVVINEHCRREGDVLHFGDDTEAYRNVRAAGEDLMVGDIVIAKGTRLNAAHAGLLASLGIREVSVKALPKVAFLSTGDELVPVDSGAPLQEGQIFDSNRHTLKHLLSQLPVETRDFGLVADSAKATADALSAATEWADVVVTTGGASASDADFVSKSLHELGQVAFWRIALRPGRPLGVGLVNGCLCFALPGNPVAVAVTFYQFVQPTILSMLEASQTLPTTFAVRAGQKFRKLVGRTEYQRGKLRQDNGQMAVFLAGKQGAGRLSSVAEADCLLILPPEQGHVDIGDWVEVQPMAALNHLF